jgi:hypothetical protein
MSLAGAIQLCILGGYMENIHLQMEDGFVASTLAEERCRYDTRPVIQ